MIIYQYFAVGTKYFYGHPNAKTRLDNFLSARRTWK